MEKGKFSILDQVREETSKRNVPLTLSVGVGSGDLPLSELGAIGSIWFRFSIRTRRRPSSY